MIAADRPDRRSARLFAVEADGTMRDLPRAGLAMLFDPGDLVVAKDAATLPASLHGTHVPSGEAIEIRLAGWLSFPDPTRFVAIASGLARLKPSSSGFSIIPDFSSCASQAIARQCFRDWHGTAGRSNTRMFPSR
jgi:S-adenosylmethionine:tRNA-ribosyltransferase-isomerase (queuine synthetase)